MFFILLDSWIHCGYSTRVTYPEKESETDRLSDWLSMECFSFCWPLEFIVDIARMLPIWSYFRGGEQNESVVILIVRGMFFILLDSGIHCGYSTYVTYMILLQRRRANKSASYWLSDECFSFCWTLEFIVDITRVLPVWSYFRGWEQIESVVRLIVWGMFFILPTSWIHCGYSTRVTYPESETDRLSDWLSEECFSFCWPLEFIMDIARIPIQSKTDRLSDWLSEECFSFYRPLEFIMDIARIPIQRRRAKRIRRQTDCLRNVFHSTDLLNSLWI